MIKKKQKNDMVLDIASVLTNFSAAITTTLATIWGKILLFSLFIAATFAGIAGLIHITLILCFVDMILGLGVTIYKKGWNHIMSSKLRNTLIKVFFYLLFLMLLFLIEKQLVDDFYITSKIAFAIISAVEMLSIAANTLILFPNFPFLKIFSKYLTKEMCKKLDIAEEDIDKILNENKIKNDTKTNI